MLSKQFFRNIFLWAFLSCAAAAFLYSNFHQPLWIALTFPGAIFLLLILFELKRAHRIQQAGQFIDINSSGFTYITNQEQQIYLWRNIAKITYNGNEVRLMMKSKALVVFSEETKNMSQMLLAMPYDVDPMAYDIIRRHLEPDKENYRACKVCGHYAVSAGVMKNGKIPEGFIDNVFGKYPLYIECGHCYTEAWNRDLNVAEEEYIKSAQLRHFGEDGLFEVNFYEKNGLYKRVQGWKPLVTDEEVMDYSAIQFDATSVNENKEIVKREISSYNTCDICGFVAIPLEKSGTVNDCEVCYETPWNENMETDRTAYIIEMQTEHFSTLEAEEKVEFYPAGEKFKQDKTWKPMVTETEVLNYSKKEYWD